MDIHEQHHAIGNALQILRAHGIEPLATSTSASRNRAEILIHALTDARKIGDAWTIAGGIGGRYHLSHPLSGVDVLIVLDLPGDILYRRGDVIYLSQIGGAA